MISVSRAPNEKAAKAKKLFESGMKLVEIAAQLGVPDGTVRRWKSTGAWGSERSDKGERSENTSAGSGERDEESGPHRFTAPFLPVLLQVI